MGSVNLRTLGGKRIAGGDARKAGCVSGECLEAWPRLAGAFGMNKSRFRSRSMRRFPCGTQGFGIVTDYLRAGFSEQGRGRGQAEAHRHC